MTSRTKTENYTIVKTPFSHIFTTSENLDQLLVELDQFVRPDILEKIFIIRIKSQLKWQQKLVIGVFFMSGGNNTKLECNGNDLQVVGWQSGRPKTRFTRDKVIHDFIQ